MDSPAASLATLVTRIAGHRFPVDIKTIPIYGMSTKNAYEAAAKALAARGMTSRQRGDEKTLQVLTWTYRWRWVTPAIIQQITGTRNQSFPSKLVQAGYLCEVPTHFGTGGNGYPSKLLFLTRKGRARLTELGFEAQQDFSLTKSFNSHTLRHDNIVQSLTLDWLNSAPEGIARDYVTPAELRYLGSEYLGYKRPDALWQQSDAYGRTETLGLELELSPKHSSKLTGFINGCLAMRTAQVPIVDAVVVVALAEQAVMRGYKLRTAEGQSRAVWDADARAYGPAMRISADESSFFRFARLDSDLRSPESLAVTRPPAELGKSPYDE